MSLKISTEIHRQQLMTDTCVCTEFCSQRLMTDRCVSLKNIYTEFYGQRLRICICD